MTNTSDKKKRSRKGSTINPGPFQVKTILTGGDGIPRRPKRPPEDILFGPDSAPTSVKRRRDSTQSASGQRSAADILFDGTSSETSPASTPAKTRRGAARTTAAQRTAADILFGKNEPKPNARSETGIATNDRIKSGSGLEQQGRREETDSDIWGVRRRRASTIDSEKTQVAEGFLAPPKAFAEGTPTKPSLMDDIMNAGAMFTRPPSKNVDIVEGDIRRLLRIAEARNFPFPSRLLRHFLDRTGNPVRIQRDEALGLGPVANAQAVNQERFKRSFWGKGAPGTKSFEKDLLALQDGAEPIKLHDNWDKAISGLGELGFGEFSTTFGLGDVQFSSSGDFDAVRSGDTITITGSVRHWFVDDYKFEKDKFPKYLSNRGVMLQENGHGTPYKMWANWEQDVEVKIEVVNGKLQEPKITWTDVPVQRPAFDNIR